MSEKRSKPHRKVSFQIIQKLQIRKIHMLYRDRYILFSIHTNILDKVCKDGTRHEHM